MFPETGDDLKMKDSSEESEKAFSGFFFVCVLKSALFKTTLDATSFLSYSELLIKMCTKINYLAVLFRLPY